jgi:hypothetical protein
MPEAAVEPGSVGGAVLVEILVVDVEVERRLARAAANRRRAARRRFGRRFGGRRRLAGAGIEQRIALELLGDEALDLEVGQSQQPDRLLELGRHHQRLALAEIEARPQSHGYSSKLSPR